VSHYGGNANINIDRNTNINRGDVNVGRGGASTRPAGGSSQWKPDKQPGQVSNSIGKTGSSARVGDARSGGGAGSGGVGAARPSSQPSGIGGAGGARPSTQPSGGMAGGGSANRGGAAFNDYGSGRQTQMDSSRGASSRGMSSGAGARPTPSGGGARSMPSGGGARAGGGARGGGGGGRGGGRR
jgi:hypothetical protein